MHHYGFATIATIATVATIASIALHGCCCCESRCKSRCRKRSGAKRPQHGPPNFTVDDLRGSTRICVHLYNILDAPYLDEIATFRASISFLS